MAIGIEDRVVVSPASWPSRATVAPGDLSSYAPIGLGLAPPIIVQPWDTLAGAMSRGTFYAANARTGDPLRDAPVNDAAGGIIYFDSGIELAKLAELFAVLDVRTRSMAYAVYAAESSNPPADRYLAQMRIVDFAAMELFGAIPDAGDVLKEQALSIGDCIGAFIEAQQKRWGSGMSTELRGTLNGDGDWAREKLGFGFMIENGSSGVYRVWSRPWLVTK